MLCNKPKGSPNLEPLIRCDKANPYGFVHDRALCCISVATCSVEFQLNEFICLTNVTESGEFPARWLVSVKVLRWWKSPKATHKPTQPTLIKTVTLDIKEQY